jgi:hypothetical protein
MDKDSSPLPAIQPTALLIQLCFCFPLVQQSKNIDLCGFCLYVLDIQRSPYFSAD